MVHSSARSTPAGGSRIDRLSQRSRRGIVVATLAGLALMYIWSAFWLSTTVPTLIWGPISFLLIGATVAGSLVLYRFVRDRADLRGRLDERQRLLRDQAWVLSYRLLSTVVVIAVAFVALQVLAFGRTIALDGALVGALAITVGVLIPIVPVAALAWIEPDALPQDA